MSIVFHFSTEGREMDGKLETFIIAVIWKEPHLAFSRLGVETASAAIQKLNGNQLTNGRKTTNHCFSMPQNKWNFIRRRLGGTSAAIVYGGHASKELKISSWARKKHRSIVCIGAYHVLNARDILSHSKMERMHLQINRMESSQSPN